MSAHTPGPWQVSGVRHKLGDEDCQVVGPDGYNIAFLPIGRSFEDLAGAMADARLIAAAPRLLEALHEQIEPWAGFSRVELERRHLLGEINTPSLMRIFAARAAIHEATGKAP